MARLIFGVILIIAVLTDSVAHSSITNADLAASLALLLLTFGLDGILGPRK